MSNTEEEMVTAGFQKPVAEHIEEQTRIVLEKRLHALANEVAEASKSDDLPGLTRAIRVIVREELAAMRKQLVQDVLHSLETEIRLRAGMISINEAREKL